MNRYVVHNISVPILPKTQIRQAVAPDTSELVAMYAGEKEQYQEVGELLRDTEKFHQFPGRGQRPT